jgi:hypothetical protein
MVFSAWSERHSSGEPEQYPCGGGIEYLHRSPASRKSRRKGIPVPGLYNWATLFLGDINTGTWPSRLAESQQLGQQNLESRGSQTREGLRWRVQAAAVNYGNVLSSERAPHMKKPAIVRQKKKSGLEL